MRRELEVPHELSGRGPEGDDGVRVQVVAGPPVAVQVGTGVAGGPVEQIEPGVVAAGQPGGAAPAPQHLRIAPRFRPRLARRGNRPEAPRPLAGVGVIGVEESAEPGVAGADARDDEVADHQRRRHRAVVLAVVVHLGVPRQRPGEAVEGDDVGVVGDREQEVAPHRDAAVEPDRGVADEPLGPRLRVAPDLASGRRVERVYLVHRGDVHHAGDDHRRPLQHRHVGNREEPLRGETVDVAPVDLIEGAVAVPRVAAVVGRPVDGGGDGRLAVGVALPPQQAEAPVRGPELGVEPALVEEGAVERASVRQDDRARPRARRQGVAGGRGRSGGQGLQIGDEVGELRLGQLEPRHAPRGNALGDDAGEPVGPAQVEHRHDRAGPIAAGAVAAMAERAAGLVRLFAVGRGQGGRQERENGNQ